MYKRNFEDPQQHDFKAASHVSGQQFHHKQYHKLNAQYQYALHPNISRNRFFEPQYNSTQELQKEEKAFFMDAARQQNL